MTITIRTQVSNDVRTGQCRAGDPLPWSAWVCVEHDDGRRTNHRGRWVASWPEAMQAAYKLRSDLDRELMDEIHAERTTRRKTKEAEDVHTMEATA